MLRVGVDLDGTLADLSSAYARVEQRVHGDSDGLVWDAIRAVPDFWLSLECLEYPAITRLNDLARTRQWEVFFVTQRPTSAGESVQRQTQRWLMAHGFELPSVVTIPGSRGKAAMALDLDFLIDDLPRNCVDIVAESRCRPILVLRQPNQEHEELAARFHISVARSVEQALDLVLGNQQEQPERSLGERLLRRLGLT